MKLQVVYLCVLCATVAVCKLDLLNEIDGNQITSSPNIQQIKTLPSQITVPSAQSLLKSTFARPQTPNRVRSVLRNFYFTFRYYEPEVQLAQCMMRFAGRSEFRIIDEVTQSVGVNATEYMHSLFNKLGATIGQFMDTLVCDESQGDRMNCKQLNRRHDTSSTDADGTMDVLRVISTNAAEKWLRSLRLLRPIMESVSSVDMRLVGQYVAGELERNLERISEFLLPGLFLCTKRYMHQAVWRMFESWL